MTMEATTRFADESIFAGETFEPALAQRGFAAAWAEAAEALINGVATPDEVFGAALEQVKPGAARTPDVFWAAVYLTNLWTARQTEFRAWFHSFWIPPTPPRKGLTDF